MFSWTVAFSALGIVGFSSATLWTFLQPMNPDEMEHLHSTYLILQGLRPYEDFWQNHAPMLWLLFAPVMRVWPEGASICYVARSLAWIGSLLLFLLVVRLALDLRPDAVSRSRTIAIAAAGYWIMAIPAELTIFRPDALMILGCLLAMWIAVRAERVAEDPSRLRLWLWCGVLLAAGLSFSTKVFPVVLAAPLAIAIRPGGLGEKIRSILVYSLGGILGVLPLAVALLAAGNWTSFYRWVVVFNRMRSGAAQGYETWWMVAFLLAGTVLAVWSLGDPRTWPRRPGLTARFTLAAVLLCSWMLYPLEQRAFAYYVAPLIACVAIFLPTIQGAGAGPRRTEARVRPVAVGALVLALVPVVTGVVPAWEQLRSVRAPETRLANNLTFIQWMIDAGAGTVVECNVPAHPIYAFDLTPFYVPWQYHYAALTGTRRARMLRELLEREEPFDEVLERRKPTLLHILTVRSHLSLLQRAALIDEAGLDRVRSILVREYREVNGTLWVRRSPPPR
ncbi:MAG: hypothetical protein R3E12_06955 [Candidatus Eisenbacteria bacterium]